MKAKKEEKTVTQTIQQRKESGSPIQNYDAILDLLKSTGMFKHKESKGHVMEDLEDAVEELKSSKKAQQ